MFNKFQQLGQLNKLRQQAKTLQDELSQIKEYYQDSKYKFVITGDQCLEYAEIDGVPQPDLVKAINETLANVQKKAAKKMLEMGGGLSGLLGGMGSQ